MAGEISHVSCSYSRNRSPRKITQVNQEISRKVKKKKERYDALMGGPGIKLGLAYMHGPGAPYTLIKKE